MGLRAAGDLLDPKNNMPLAANQQPSPGQVKPLPTERAASTIPKGGTDDTWMYPSPQMFFNGDTLTIAYISVWDAASGLQAPLNISLSLPFATVYFYVISSSVLLLS